MTKKTDVPNMNFEISDVDSGASDASTDASGMRFLTITVLLILVLIGVIVAYVFFTSLPESKQIDRYADVLNGIETNESYMYNGLVFLYNGFLWETVIRIDQDYLDIPIEASLATYYGPKEVADIPIYGPIENIDRVATVYLSFSPDLDVTQVLAGVEVGKIVSKKFNLYNKDVFHAVLTPYNGTYPVVTCDNVTSSTMVIEFVLTNTTQIVQTGNCLSIEGVTSEDLLRAADRYIFRLLNVMKE